MTADLLMIMAGALVCTVIVWILREMIMCPIKPGKNSSQYIVVRVYGEEPALEEHLKGLLWLRSNRTLKCPIIVCGEDLDEETRFVAKAMADDNDCISFYENGDTPGWIRKPNF